MNYGRYQIIEEIGRGSMGMVYKAHDPNLDMDVALKVLRQDRVESESFLRRFVAEARVLGRLSHPSIVRVYNVDEDSGTVYIAMEFIEGESLEKIIEKERLSPAEIVRLGMTIGETLIYAHQNGIVHRDIKPSNILIGPDRNLKITESYGAEKTQAGEILGTPAYMSPEQVLSRKVDGRSDLFSLGIILYELCTKIRPFQGENLASLFHAITSDDPIPVIKRAPEVPSCLSRIIMKCLEKKPDDRYECAELLVEALRSCLKTQESKVTKPIPKRFRPRNMVLIASVILTLILVAGGTVFYFMKENSSQTVEQRIMSTLSVTSLPAGAQLFIDESARGETPIDVELDSGKHTVKLTKQNFYDWEATLQLTSEARTPLNVQLIPLESK